MAMLACGDLRKSKTFYRDILGLLLIKDAAPHWVEFELGNGHRLGLHPASETLAVVPGSLHLTFTVPNVDLLVSDARMAGIKIFQEPFSDTVGRIAVISDPDGYPVQVMSPAKVAKTRS